MRLARTRPTIKQLSGAGITFPLRCSLRVSLSGVYAVEVCAQAVAEVADVLIRHGHPIRDLTPERVVFRANDPVALASAVSAGLGLAAILRQASASWTSVGRTHAPTGHDRRGQRARVRKPCANRNVRRTSFHGGDQPRNRGRLEIATAAQCEAGRETLFRIVSMLTKLVRALEH